MEVLDQLAVALGFATLAGLNLYLTVFLAGMAIRFHWIELLPQYEALGILGGSPVLIISGLLFFLEFFADKIPWIDSLWDMLQTFIRPVGGALLALQTLGEVNPAIEVVIALVAGSATLVTHGFKASTRLAINASPEPISNIATSVAEDAAVAGGTFLMFLSPKIALLVFVVFLGFVIYITPRLWRRIRTYLLLFLYKLRAPATNKKSANLPSRLTSEEDILISAELLAPDPQVEFAVPAFTGRVKGLSALAPNLSGKLVAAGVKPGHLLFVGRKNWRSILKTFPLAGCHVSHEPRFLSEDLVLSNKDAKFRLTLRLPRGHGAQVEALAARLQELAETESMRDASDAEPLLPETAGDHKP